MKQLAPSMYCSGINCSRGIRQPGKSDSRHCLAGGCSFSITCRLFSLHLAKPHKASGSEQLAFAPTAKQKWIWPIRFHSCVVFFFFPSVFFVQCCVCPRACSELVLSKLTQLAASPVCTRCPRGFARSCLGSALWCMGEHSACWPYVQISLMLYVMHRGCTDMQYP